VVQNAALDHGAVGGESSLVVHEDVDAAESVIPVLVVEVPFEGVVQEGAGGAEFGGGEVRCVGGTQSVGHRPSISSWFRWMRKPGRGSTMES
jgi:hypothetical protein